MNTDIIKVALIKNTLKLTSGSVINYVIPIVTTPILTRIFSPADYGVWGIFSSIATILTVFVCGGYEYAIVESENEEERNNVVKLCVGICTIFNLLLTLFFFIMRLLGSSLFEIGDLIFLVPLYLLLTGFLSILQNYSNAHEFYKTLAVSQIVAGVTLALSRIVLGLLNIQNGLVYGAALSSIITVIYLYFPSLKGGLSLFTQTSSGSLKELIVKYKNYPLFDAPSTFIVYLSNNIPVLLLSRYFGKDLLGGYTMVLQLLLLPMSFIGANMGRVFFQQISNDKSMIAPTSHQVYKISFLLGLAIIVFFLLGGDYLLYWILGHDWSIAGEYALYLSLWSFFTISYAPLKPIYRVKKKQNVQMIIMIIALIVQTTYLLLAAKTFDNISFVILYYSIVCSVFKIVEGIVLKKLCGLPVRKNTSLQIVSVIVVAVWIVRSMLRVGLI